LGVVATLAVMWMGFSLILFTMHIQPALNVILGYEVLYAIMIGGIGVLGTFITGLCIHLLKRSEEGIETK